MGPNQEFKNELDRLIDRQLLPEERDFVRAYDRAVLLESVRVLEHAGPSDWERPTPCADWDLRALVAHMAGQHHGFAAAADGAGADLSHWQPLPLGDDPLGDDPFDVYRAAVTRVVESFARPGVAERRFDLPEISTTRSFPARVAVEFHFLDYAVHTWDVAKSIGLDWEPDDDIAEAALAVALRVPDDERRLAPGAAFGPARTPARDGRPFDLVLATLGRSPAWTP
ncbi:TIGR03086 family metal-binding protein [Streptomyces sp. NPDC006645]|uniref:TIGR03086 family metal-binding protein n=1 Tax=unclassified Streptomyces TaxID=2593676 RepID=UPI00339E9072